MKDRIARWVPVAVALLALLASANGIVNGFTYDDRYIIQLNPAMRDLAHWWRSFTSPYWPPAWGGDGYRPLTVLLFRIEYGLGRGSPMLFHAANIVLYMVASVMVYVVAAELVPLWAAGVVAALYAVHPVHVEAVANVVGQSELLVAATILPAIAIYIRQRKRAPNVSWRAGLAIGLLYALGCMAKEHAIVLPAILACAELTVLDEARTIRQRLSDARLRVLYLALAAVAVVFVAVRSVVIADHGIGGFLPFMPFAMLRITSFQRVLTAVGVVPQWLRLFYWPARLSSEYGPPDVPIAQGFEIWELPGFLLLVAILTLGVLLRRRAPVISFAIGFVCVALLPSSNFLIPAGIVLAERTLFLPSVGAMLVIGGLVTIVAAHVAREAANRARVRNAAWAAFVLVLIAGAGRSIARTPAWHDNGRLFHQAVIDSPLSYRAHYMWGSWSLDEGRMREGEAEMRHALNLFPYDPGLSYNLAEQYRRVGLCAPAVPLYRWTRDLYPDFPFGRAAHAACLLEVGSFDEAKRMALLAVSAGGEVRQARRIIFLADSAKAAEVRGRNAPGVGQAGTPGKLPETVQKAR